MQIKTLEVAGFAAAMKSLRYPFNKEHKSSIETTTSIAQFHIKGYPYHFINDQEIMFHEDDIHLAETLEQRGDEHAKPLRGIIVWADIEAPIYFWWDLETYRAGHERLFSASTMHTEGRGLSGKALTNVRSEIPFGRLVKKIDYFSYQTLRRIIYQRYDHRSEEFHIFIEWILTLPLADRLIVRGLEDKVAHHKEMWKKMQEED